MDETLVPILCTFAIFGSIAAMIIVPFWLKERTKQSAHRVISEAVARGQPLDPAIMDQLTQAVGTKQQQSSPRRTLGNGLVLLALGIAFGVADWFKNGSFSGGLEWPAMILGALGLAFTILAIVDYITQKTDK
jgi:hypothetical protein